MTTDVSPTPVADPTSLTLTSPALLAAVGLYAAAAGHVIAALVHLSHGWSITAFFLVAAAALVTLATAPALLPDRLRRSSTTVMLLVGAGMWAAWATGLV